MGVDVATWRARIGLNYYRHSRYTYRPLPVQWRAARWGVEEVMNSTPSLLQGWHGDRLPVTGTGIFVPRASHLEEWVWQGVLSQVEKRLCTECGG